MLFGAKGQRNARAATVRPDNIHGIELDVRDIPDLDPALAAVEACAEGTTSFTGCSRLRIKECDRLEAIATELGKLGASARADGDALVIEGREQLDGGRMNSRNDHRIAMMAAIAAVRCASPVEIEGSHRSPMSSWPRAARSREPQDSPCAHPGACVPGASNCPET